MYDLSRSFVPHSSSSAFRVKYAFHLARQIIIRSEATDLKLCEECNDNNGLYCEFVSSDRGIYILLMFVYVLFCV